MVVEVTHTGTNEWQVGKRSPQPFGKPHKSTHRSRGAAEKKAREVADSGERIVVNQSNGRTVTIRKGEDRMRRTYDPEADKMGWEYDY